MAKFQCISQDQSAYKHWVGQMRVQLKTFAKQCKTREYPESEQTDGYGTDGETAGRMATSAKFQSISQDQSAYNHWVGQMKVWLNTFAKQRKNRKHPEAEQTDSYGSYGTDGETAAGRMANMAKFQSISQDQSAYNHWVGQMRVQLNTFAKQRKNREYPESEQTDGYGTDGETAGRMATTVKFQSISQDQSAYNHWVGQMRVQLKNDTELQSEEKRLVILNPILINRKAKPSLIHPEPDPDSPTSEKPSKISKRCCCMGWMLLLVVLVLAVALAAWVASEWVFATNPGFSKSFLGWCAVIATCSVFQRTIKVQLLRGSWVMCNPLRRKFVTPKVSRSLRFGGQEKLPAFAAHTWQQTKLRFLQVSIHRNKALRPQKWDANVPCASVCLFFMQWFQVTARSTNQTAEAQMRSAMSCPFEGGRGITPCGATNLQGLNASRII